MELPVAFTAALELAINRYLELDPHCLQKLAQLEGRVIAIELKGLNIRLFMIPTQKGLQVYSLYDGEVDTSLVGTPIALMRMGLSSHSENQLFSGDVEITGDIETGQAFKAILDELDIDWEEHLSHITGDVIAHQVGKTVRAALNWGSQAADTLLQDTSEYLQEEKRVVATGFELEDFAEQIDTLRNDTDRMQARLKRLQDKLKTEQQDNGETSI